MTLFVDVVRSTGAVTVLVRGDLDLATGEELCRAVEAAEIGPDTDVEVDLDGVTFVDCAGLRALLRSVRSARRRGRSLSVTHTSCCVQRLSRAWGMPEGLRAA